MRNLLLLVAAALVAVTMLVKLAGAANAQTSRELVAPWTICGHTACITGNWSFHPGSSNGHDDIFTTPDGRSVTIWRNPVRNIANWDSSWVSRPDTFILGGFFRKDAVVGGTAYNGLVGSRANPDAVRVIINPEVNDEEQEKILQSLSWRR